MYIIVYPRIKICNVHLDVYIYIPYNQPYVSNSCFVVAHFQTARIHGDFVRYGLTRFVLVAKHPCGIGVDRSIHCAVKLHESGGRGMPMWRRFCDFGSKLRDIKDFKCENWYMAIIFWNKMTCIWHKRPRICSQKIASKHVLETYGLATNRQEKHLVTQSCVVWCLQLVVATNWAWMISVNLASKNFVTWTNRSSLLGKDMGSFRFHVEISNSRKGPNACSGCIPYPVWWGIIIN